MGERDQEGAVREGEKKQDVVHIGYASRHSRKRVVLAWTCSLRPE